MKYFWMALGICSLMQLSSVTVSQAANREEGKASAKAQNLDGKTFAGKVGEAGSKEADPDDFTFADGNFHSSACDQYGYTKAPYTSKSAKAGTTFNSTTKNDSGDTITWNGVVEGNKVSGTAVRKTSDGKAYKMWFEGNAKG